MLFIVELFIRKYYFININVINFKAFSIFMYVVFIGISAPLSSFNLRIFLSFDTFLLFLAVFFFYLLSVRSYLMQTKSKTFFIIIWVLCKDGYNRTMSFMF